jgi:dienelactone hydrolase
MAEFIEVPLQHEGAALRGLMLTPAGAGPHPAVLVMNNAMGQGEQVRARARRLAALGYVALATDMYGGGAHFTDGQAAGELFAPLVGNPSRLRGRVVAWLETLRARPEVDAGRLAAIGFCFGGQCVLELARSGADLKAVVSYHGLLETAAPAEPGAVKAKVVVYTGRHDPFVPAPHVQGLREEMSRAGAHWQITEFGDAGHGFTDPDSAALGLAGVEYNALADQVSWAGTLALLDAVLR